MAAKRRSSGGKRRGKKARVNVTGIAGLAEQFYVAVKFQKERKRVPIRWESPEGRFTQKMALKKRPTDRFEGKRATAATLT